MAEPFETEPAEYEYLLMLEPRQIMQKIRAFKDKFEAYHFKNVFITPAHITLMHFLRFESFENGILKKMRQVATSTKPFDIEINGFDKFLSSSHTVYMKIKTVDPILDIVANRKREMNELVKGSKTVYPSYDKEPHITIARGLTTEQFEQVWPDWRKEYFEAKFTASEMLLLKRKYNGDKKKKNDTWKEVERFAFKGETPPPAPVQMDLFG